MIHLSENIANFRRQKGVTQEELANFLGVTKASVSKWETKQSLPDILLLPQLATFFDVSVDALLGYEPQLSKEQIQTYYHNLANDFATKPFEEVIATCQVLMKKYYHCYPFLLQMAILYINHFMLTENPIRQQEILQMAFTLCEHIEKNCTQMSVCHDALFMKASIYLLLKKPQEVIALLEEQQSPYRLSINADHMLSNAYYMAGQFEKADSFTQISLYLYLLSLVQNTAIYLELHSQEPKRCKEIMERTDALIEIFDLEQLHSNMSFMFYYECALVLCQQNKKEEALARLSQFVHLLCKAFETNNICLHGDAYFPRLDDWFQNLDLGNGLPRDKRVILNSAVEALQNPLFAILESEVEFQKLKQELKKLIS